MKKLHLISNAHLDPVWQWEWEEGAAAAVSTFRAAASFCEEWDGYVFNHNEALLYKWIEEYEPALFERIQRLAREGKWHIMGGWYLQPDCNMPSGESMVRQMLYGRTYFQEKFGQTPTTAINFDSFGHSRGLVQIMRQAGFDSYLFMRPDGRVAGPAQDFVWVGFDGSELLAHQINNGYNSLLGQARTKVEQWLEEHPDQALSMVLWGVGNHGGGPSRADLKQLAELAAEQAGAVEIVHSTPEQYFAELGAHADELPRLENDLNPRFVGCYTSMIRIKMGHRKLENELFLTEKMLSAAALSGLLNYPMADLSEAFHDLMLSQFHDILPGSSVQPAEEASLRLIDHGLEIASRLKARAFFALAAGQPEMAEGEYPILVYNPHPYPIRGVFACEFMLADQNWKDEYSLPVVFHEGVRIPSQGEKEHSNLSLDWRKRVVFEAELAPFAMNRFACRIELLPAKPKPELAELDGYLTFHSDKLSVKINTHTGLLDAYEVNGVSMLAAGAFLPVVVADNEDPWRMDTNCFEPDIGAFRLMDPGAGTDFSGVKNVLLPSVRVIEDGEVRTVIEALLEYGRSVVILTYKLPKRGTQVEVGVRVFWNEKDKMLKLSLPTLLEEPSYRGQTIYGVQPLPQDGTEAVAQRWTALVSHQADAAVTLINDGIYGSDCRGATLRPTLLRSAGYTAHPILDRPLMPSDRFSPRIDQGERQFTFWLNAGPAQARMRLVDREAQALAERPYALSFCPSGQGQLPQVPFVLDNETVVVTAFKPAEDGDGYIVRLFEPTGQARTAVLRFPAHEASHLLAFKPFEVKTLRVKPHEGKAQESPLMEQ
ncbi:glycoside hydrolase family 38 C-terminal domain-containing protein [Paenibacillus ferrarius]|uniref:glycoside hydrolase family 38 N-terminal domain-containing protein n=1 Tax=Paenibacillus ferrarius TaxID=1469647 RepID=UPI003D28F003